MCVDTKNLYLATLMDRLEYMKIPIAIIPDEFIDTYNLNSFIKNGYIQIQIEKVVYGLPQAGILTNKLLRK